VSFVGTPIAIPHMKSGRLKALGVSTAKRSPEMPVVPTIAEAGVPGFEALVWIGMLAPAGTPPEIVAKLNAEAVRYLGSAEAKEAFGKVGHEPLPSSPGAVRARVAAEQKSFARAVKDAGLKPE